MPAGLPLASAKLRSAPRCDGHKQQRHYSQTAPHPLFTWNLDRGLQIFYNPTPAVKPSWMNPRGVHPNLIDTRAGCNIKSLLIGVAKNEVCNKLRNENRA